MSTFDLPDWLTEFKPDPTEPGTSVDPGIYQALWSGKRGADAHVKCIGIRGELAPDHIPPIQAYFLSIIRSIPGDAPI
jgi:hypothetical protein